MDPTDWYFWFSIITFIFEGYGFTGIIFGFPNLVLILQSEGVWNESCILPQFSDANVTAIDCIDETANYGTITTIAILAGNIMSLPLGILLDKKGTFICRIVCTLLITIGVVSLFFVTETPELLYLAIPCFGAGGFTLLTTNFQLAILTTMSGLVTLAIQACFGASGTIFRLFVAAGADLKTIAGVLLAGTSIIWIRTFFLMPKMWILKTADFQSKLAEITPLRKESEETSPRRKSVKWNELKKSIFTGLYLAFLYWFSVANSFITFFVSVLSNWAGWVLVDEENGEKLVNVFGTLLALTIVFGPTAGVIIDGVSKMLQGNIYMTERTRRIVGCAICLIFNIVFGVLVCFLSSFKSESVAISAIVIFQAQRIYTYGMAAAFLQSAFLQDQFGSLMGVARLVIGLTSLVNLLLIANIGKSISLIVCFIGYGIAILSTLVLPMISFWIVYQTVNESKITKRTTSH